VTRLWWRFAVYTAAAVLLAGAGELAFLREDAVRRVESALGANARFVAEASLNGALRRSDFTRPVSSQRRRVLTRMFRRNVLAGGIATVKLWSPDGVVTYAGGRKSSAEAGRDDDTVGRAMRGEQAYEVTSAGERTLSVYTPFRLRPGERPVGVLELYTDYAPVAAAARGAVLRVATAIGLTLLAVYISLFPILRRVTSALRARNRRLADQAAQLSDALAEQQAAEDALLAANGMLGSVIEASPLAIIAVDRQGHVQTWNRAAEQIFGWSRDEVIGKRNPIVPEAEIGAHLERVANELDPGVREVQRRRKDGSVVHVSLTTASLRDPDGHRVGAVGLFRDISDRKQAEEQAWLVEKALAERTEQLRQAQKLEAVGRLAGGVAHDFNNLLTVITGRADLLRDVLVDDERSEHVDEIADAAARAARLTAQLLAFARKQVLEPRALDVTAVVRDVAPLLERLLGEDVELVLRLDARVGAVHADRGQLEQVLVNLAVNARDAMPGGGRLSIETANVSTEPREDGAGLGSVRLRVADTGVGMDEATCARAFEPFFTTKEGEGGTGLGLATVYGIVTQSGGRIALESEPGGGTSVDILLPRVACPTVALESPPAVRGPAGAETILLAEDEPTVQKVVVHLLERSGYTVFAAPDGATALQLHEQLSRPVDLLITDVRMPGMNGRDLAQRLRLAQPGLPVLLVSGYAEDAVDGLTQADDLAFLQKPFSGEELAAKVQTLLGAGNARSMSRPLLPIP